MRWAKIPFEAFVALMRLRVTCPSEVVGMTRDPYANILWTHPRRQWTPIHVSAPNKEPAGTEPAYWIRMGLAT